jgi:hypothetical protein
MTGASQFLAFWIIFNMAVFAIVLCGRTDGDR